MSPANTHTGVIFHALGKVAEYTVPAAWVRDHMGKAESMKYCRAKAIPSALFGGGIPNSDCAWATPVGNALYRVALGYEQSPEKALWRGLPGPFFLDSPRLVPSLLHKFGGKILKVRKFFDS